MRTIKEIQEEFEEPQQSPASVLNSILELLLSDEFAERIASKIMRYEFTPEDLRGAKKEPLTHSSDGAGGNNIEYKT